MEHLRGDGRVAAGGRAVALRAARPEDSDAIADIWRDGWRDGHVGFVPEALARARTDASFQVRASQRLDDTTVAVVADAVAGFVMVVDDEVEQVYVSAHHRGQGIADVLLRGAERQIGANGHRRAWLAVVAGNVRARAFYTRMGWHDEGPFEYAAHGDDGPITVPCHRYARLL
ncbi:MAG TPA: GNAT family N-acetyltransferase [Euzebyales bacterium]|nr:GNAT family N-acetyltransferase [Euzebyales bacterium]